MPSSSPDTPCSVMFDLLKRYGKISYVDLGRLILSGRPLPDGVSPRERAKERSWLSRSVVHAPVGTIQTRFFADYGKAAKNVLERLRSRRQRNMSDAEIIEMVCGREGHAMDEALRACHQDARLYRNALERFANASGHQDGERAEAVLVLFIAMGCSSNVHDAVRYALDIASGNLDMRTSTPSAMRMLPVEELGAESPKRPLGLLRVEDGHAMGDPQWIDPEAGALIGALALGEGDITDVAADVSAKHAQVFYDDGKQSWFVKDLCSRNGTVLLSGATGEAQQLRAWSAVPIAVGDELRLATKTVYVVMC